MIKINVQTDCGNSPKKELLRDFTIAFAKSDASFILENIADTIHWEMVGDRTIDGRKSVESTLQEMLDASMQELTILNIITHGNVGAINGKMTFKDGKTYGFCDIYSFTNHSTGAKIKEITSYIVEI